MVAFRYLITRGNAFLDLVLTNDPLIISNITVSVPFCTSDHDSILLSVISSTRNKKCPPYPDGVGISSHFPNYDQANWPAFMEDLSSIDWTCFFVNCSRADGYCSEFSNCLQIGVDKFVPRKFSKNKFTSKLKDDYRKFYSKSVLYQQAKKLKLWLTCKEFPTVENKTIYKNFSINEMKTKQLIIGNNKKRIIESKNLGTLYSQINSRLTHKTGFAPLCKPALLL